MIGFEHPREPAAGHVAPLQTFARRVAEGWIFHEWKGSSKKAHTLIASGIATLILSTIIIGVGTWLKTQTAAQ